MRVRELIKALQALPQDLPVGIYSAEYGCLNHITSGSVVDIYADDGFEMRLPTVGLPHPKEDPIGKAVKLEG